MLTQMASAAAHEIFQPLTEVIGRTELLLAEMNPNDPRRSQVEAVHRAGWKISEIVKRMGSLRRYAVRKVVDGVDIIDFDAATRIESSQQRAGGGASHGHNPDC